MVDYSERLKAAMGYAGVKIPALAAALGVSYQAIKKVLDGKSKSLDAKNNAQAAKFLNVSHYWLATGEGDMILTTTAVLTAPSPTVSATGGQGIRTEHLNVAAAAYNQQQAVEAIAVFIKSCDASKRENLVNLFTLLIRNPDNPLYRHAIATELGGGIQFETNQVAGQPPKVSKHESV